MLPFVLFPLFALLSLVLFVLLLLVLFAVMFLLVLSPWRVDILQLYQITDMNYKLLLVEYIQLLNLLPAGGKKAN